ncbi:MAG: hypothetical protein DWQ53_20185 [Microcystis flos-aquae DF17]|nr:MAG: hypothetical protein DWQ53_20185 [Microcystis flos-aquae DF17]
MNYPTVEKDSCYISYPSKIGQRYCLGGWVMGVGSGGVGCGEVGKWGEQSCLLPFAFCLLPFAFCLLPFAFCLLPVLICSAYSTDLVSDPTDKRFCCPFVHQFDVFSITFNFRILNYIYQLFLK